MGRSSDTCFQEGDVVGPQQDPGQVVRVRFFSQDPGEVTEFIRHMYLEHRTQFAPPPSRTRFHAVTHDVPGLGMDRVITTLDYTSSSTDGLLDYVFMALHGGAVDVTHDRSERTTTRGESVFYPVNTPITFHVRELDATTVRLPAERLASAAQDLTGTPGHQFVMHDITPISASTNRY